MARLSLLGLLALSLASLVLRASAQAGTTTYYMCAILQGNQYVSVDTATLIVNATATLQSNFFNNQSVAYQALSLVSGQRSYTDLTVASPSAVVTPMSALAAPGSTGGNDNFLFFSIQPQQLNGNGLTFNFSSPVSISNGGNGTQMNLWWGSGNNQLDEEVSGGTHENDAQQSTLTFTTTQQACTVPSYTLFSVCLLIVGPGYTTIISGIVNTTGLPTPIAPTAANGLPMQAQGWRVSGFSNGVRTFTNTLTGTTTTTAITGIAAAANTAGNDNLSENAQSTAHPLPPTQRAAHTRQTPLTSPLPPLSLSLSLSLSRARAGCFPTRRVCPCSTWRVWP